MSGPDPSPRLSTIPRERSRPSATASDRLKGRLRLLVVRHRLGRWATAGGAALLAAWTLTSAIADAESAPLRLTPRALLYLPWLIGQILRANVDVARRILSPRLPIQPSLMLVDTRQRTDLGLVIYANSITLTPGTVSVDLEDRTIIVHALSASAAEGLAEGAMDRRVAAVEGSR